MDAAGGVNTDLRRMFLAEILIADGLDCGIVGGIDLFRAELQ